MSRCTKHKSGNIFESNLPDRGPYEGSVEKICHDEEGQSYSKQFSSYSSNVKPTDPRAVARSLEQSSSNDRGILGNMANVFKTVFGAPAMTPAHRSRQKLQNLSSVSNVNNRENYGNYANNGENGNNGDNGDNGNNGNNENYRSNGNFGNDGNNQASRQLFDLQDQHWPEPKIDDGDDIVEDHHDKRKKGVKTTSTKPRKTTKSIKRKKSIVYKKVSKKRPRKLSNKK